MNDEITCDEKTETNELMELGFALGQNHTLGVIAGRCSAAQAEGLRRLREEKLYRRCCEKWDDFCPGYLNMSRAEADRTIRLLEEFGPAYFQLSQLTRISAEAFRTIAPAVSDGVLRHKGEEIPLNADNSRRVAAAVAELRSAIPKKSAQLGELAQEIREVSRGSDVQRRIRKLTDCCVAIVAELDRIAHTKRLGATRVCLQDALSRVRDEILRVTAEQGL